LKNGLSATPGAWTHRAGLEARPPRTGPRGTQQSAPCSHSDASLLADLPTPEQIAAQHAAGLDPLVRHRPIGAVLADICRDLGILPNNPLWPELSVLVVRHGGSLASLV
jgi:hypothetical protein